MPTLRCVLDRKDGEAEVHVFPPGTVTCKARLADQKK